MYNRAYFTGLVFAIKAIIGNHPWKLDPSKISSYTVTAEKWTVTNVYNISVYLPLTIVTILHCMLYIEALPWASCLHYVWQEPGWQLWVTYMCCHSYLLSSLSTCVGADPLPVPVCVLNLWWNDVTWPLTFWGKCVWGLPSGGQIPA